jgi:parallel beta-helix repeat protein
VVIAPDSVTVATNQTVQFQVVTDSSGGVSFTSGSTKGRGRGHSKVVSLALNPVSSAVVPGGSQSFDATATLADGSTVLPSLTWAASGGTVDASGRYTAGVVNGKYRVVATASNGVADTAAVTITEIAPILAQIVLSPASISLPAGGSQQFTAEGKSADSATVSVTPAYAATGGTISSAGLYTAGQTPGTFRVIATDGATGNADTSAVTITAPPTSPTLQSVVLTPASVSLQTGAAQQFAASGRMSDGSSTTVSVTFSETGGAITSGGLYTAGQTPGTFRVIATDVATGKADSSAVTITAPPTSPTLQSVVLTPASVSLQTGATQQFAASGRMSDGSTTTVSVTFSATGGTITSGGLYTAGNGAGSYRVIITQTGGTLADTSAITITASPAACVSTATMLCPGDNIQSKLTAAGPGATLTLQPGVYRTQSVSPLQGQTIQGQPGAILDGEGQTTYAFNGGGSSVTIRGLLIKRYNPPIQYAAVQTGSSWLVESNEITESSHSGLRMGANSIARNNNIHHNHEYGVNGVGGGILVEGNTIAYNNYLDEYDIGDEGGTKFVFTTNLVLRNNWVHHNRGPGLWTDIDNVNPLIEGNTVEDNEHEGIFHEISWNATIRNNLVRRNGLGRNLNGEGAGIYISSSGGSGVEIYGNTLDGNHEGIVLRQGNRGSGIQGVYTTQNVSVHNNTVTLTGSQQQGAYSDDNSTAIFTTRNNHFEDNTYNLQSANLNSFLWNNAQITDAQWRATGNDSPGGTFNR